MNNYLNKISYKSLKSDVNKISGIVKFAVRILSPLKLKNSIKFIFLLSILISCSQSSPTVNPADLINSYFSNPPGTTQMQASIAYPSGTGIPVDASIVIVFTKDIDTTPANITGNIQINGGTVAYTPTITSRIVTLVPNSNLAYNTLYTITISSSMVDSGAIPISQAYTFTNQFRTAVDSSALSYPYALTATSYPVPLSTVSKNLSYVEITFSKPVSGASITTGVGGSFRVSSDGGVTDAGTGKTQIGTTNTWRVNLGTLTYGTTYTVTLTSGITDGTNPLQSAPVTWTFDTEADPNNVGNPSSIDNIGIASVTNTQAIICFNTDVPVSIVKSYVQYGPTTAYGTNVQETDWDSDGQLIHTNHGIIITGLTANTIYNYRVWIDNNANAIVDVGDIVSANSTFYTKTAAGGGGKVLTNAAGNQNGFKTVQNDNGSSYVFWVDAGTIYGQYIGSDGLEKWGVGTGAALSNAGAYTNIYAIKSRYSANNEVVLLYRTGTNIYAKMVHYDGTATPAFDWASPADTAGGVGITLANDSLASSSFTAALGHERPTVRTSGNATMPDNGVATSLMFDKDVDFSVISFINSSTDVRLFTNTTPLTNATWYEYTVDSQNTSRTDIYQYVLTTTPFINSPPNLNLGAYTDYYFGDAFTRLLGTSSSQTTTGIICNAGAGSLPGVIIGTIARGNVSGSTYGYAIVNSAPYPLAGETCVDLDRTVAGLNSGDAFAFYIDVYGPCVSSEAIANPLWDRTKTFITSGVTAGDIVVNENNNSVAATKAVVVGAAVSETALALDTDIMNDVDRYAIVTLPAGATYIGVGYSTSSANNYKLDDSHANFITPAPQVGDIVFNIDGNESTEILAIDSTTRLSLSADIFNAANQKYIIYRKRAFILTYIDTANDVIAKKFNLADSSSVGSTTTVEAGTFTNPHSVSDELGGAIVAYQSSTGIISVAGVGTAAALKWGPIAKTAAGYSVNQMLPDSSINSAGGAYIVDSNSSTGDINIYRINGATGATVGGWPVSVTGYSPHAAVDKYDAALPSRIILTYLPTHVTGNTYRHVGIAAYTGAGAASFAAANVTSNVAVYNCQFPRVVVSDTNAASTNEFYITWFDGRYYSSIGYALYTQRYDAAGTKYTTGNWASEIFIASPTSFGVGTELQLETLFYDVTTPRGIIPIWLDYRAGNTDIYYGLVTSTGTLP